MKQITHQQQPTPTSCVSACLAMLLDIPVKDVIDEFHDKYMKADIDADDYLKAKGVKAKSCLSTHRRIEPGKVYLIAAPSLNLEASTHEIIFDFRDDFVVLDPNMGKVGKKYYVWKAGKDLGELEVDVKSYFFDFEVEI